MMTANSNRAGYRDPVQIRSSRLVRLPAVVYGYVDAAGDWLYIGQTTNLRNRDQIHSKRSPWFPESVELRIIADCAVRSDAIVAEADAIRRLRPRHNVTHNQRGSAA